LQLFRLKPEAVNRKLVRVRFQAELETAAGPVATWTIVYMPFDVRAEFGSGGIVRVLGTINGFEFNSSIFPSKSGRHFLMVNKKMLKGARASEAGEVVNITLELDSAPKKVTVPANLRAAINRNAEARKCFDEMPPSSQRYRVEMVTDAKSAAVRERKTEELVESLAEMGRALRQPPEFMQRALAKNAVARAKYMKLSKSHLFHFLAYILQAKSQATRDRRTAKMVAMLLENKRF
jgi:uncharacterized protein YdeI (YjbR/CyaY-like superfamily)